MSTTALAPLEPINLTELRGVAEVFAASGLFADTRQMAQAFVKIMAGREIGMGAFASMQNIHIIQGRPTISANAMAAAVKRSDRYDYRITELTDKTCCIAFLDDAGALLGESRFDLDDARRAGLLKDGGNWAKYPRNMLFARAMSNGVRFYCPDVFQTAMYTPDEFDMADDTTAPPLVIDRTPEPPDDTPPAPQADESTSDPEPEPEAAPEPPAKSKRSSKPANGEYNPATDKRPFTVAMWPGMQSWIVEHGLADNDFHAFGRLRKVASVPEEEKNGGKVLEFVEKVASLTVAEIIAGFQARQSEDAVTQSA